MQEIANNYESKSIVDTLPTELASVYLQGLKIAVEQGNISCVTLQRKLRIGYVVAHKILNWMTECDFVEKGTPNEYVKRTLISVEEYEQLVKSADGTLQ